MTKDKTDSEKKTKPDTQEGYEAISKKTREAAESVRQLIINVGTTVENKIALEDQINGLSDKAESMLIRIDDMAKANQKKLLLAYKQFLEHNLEAVDHRLQALK